MELPDQIIPNGDLAEREKQHVVQQWQGIKKIENTKKEAILDRLRQEQIIMPGSIFEHSSLENIVKLSNQDTIPPPTKSVAKSIQEFLEDQKLISPGSGAPLPSADGNLLLAPSDTQRHEALEMARAQAREKLPHIIYYLAATATRHDIVKQALRDGTLKSADTYKITAPYVHSVLLCVAHAPFSPCRAGSACIMNNLPNVRTGGPRNCIQMIYPHQWQEYITTGQKPKNLEEFCFVCMCIIYNRQRDSGVTDGTNTLITPPFEVECDVPSGYHISACRGVVLGTGPKLTSHLRHPMATDFYEDVNKKDFIVFETYADGRPPQKKTIKIPGWRERSELICGDGSRVSNMRANNPATQLVQSEQEYSLEEALRRFIEHHRKGVLLRQTLPALMKKMATEYAPKRHPWFDMETIKSKLEQWIKTLTDEKRPCIDRYGLTHKSQRDALSMFELRASFEKMARKYFAEQQAQALQSVAIDNLEQRAQVETEAAAILSKVFVHASEQAIRDQEDGFLAVADMCFRSFPELVLLFSDDESILPGGSSALSRIDRNAYLAENTPTDFLERPERYTSSYFKLPNLEAYPSMCEPGRTETYYYLYSLLFSMNVAQYFKAELLEPELKGSAGVVGSVMERMRIEPNWKTQDERQRELDNVKAKIEEYMSCRVPALTEIQRRITERVPIHDSALMEQEDSAHIFLPFMQGVHAPEDRKYVNIQASIHAVSIPHAESLTYLSKSWPQILNQPTTTTTPTAFGIRQQAIRQKHLYGIPVPAQQPILTPPPVASELFALITIESIYPYISLAQKQLLIPLNKILCDFNETRIWIVTHLQDFSVPSIFDAIQLKSWLSENRTDMRLIPYQMWTELCANQHRFTAQSHSILLALLIRLYCITMLIRTTANFQKDLLQLNIDYKPSANVRQLLADFKSYTIAKRATVFMQTTAEDQQTAALLADKYITAADQLTQANEALKTLTYHLTITSWDHIGLIDALANTSADRTDKRMCHPEQYLQNISLYDCYYPFPKICLCEDNLVDCSKYMSQVRFISENGSKDPFLEGITKVQPVVCQVREMVRKNKKISVENSAYSNYTRQSVACTLIGGYRDSGIRLQPADALTIINWMQKNPNLDDKMYLIGQALRENSVMQIRNNPSFYIAVSMVFPLYHNFEWKHVPESTNFIREKLLEMLRKADVQALPMAQIIDNLSKMVEGKFKDKSIDVFRRPRGDFLKHICKCFKSACIDRYTNLYLDHINSGGDPALRPEFGPMPPVTLQDAIISHVRTSDRKPHTAVVGDVLSLRRVGLSEDGISSMDLIFKMYELRRSDEEIGMVLKKMHTEDVLLCYFYYSMLRFEDTIVNIPLPPKWTARADRALRNRYGIRPDDGIPMNVACLYFCSSHIGCGRLTSVSTQSGGLNSYGNSYMWMNWDRNALVCRPKKTNNKPVGAVDSPISNSKLQKIKDASKQYAELVAEFRKLGQQQPLPDKAILLNAMKKRDAQCNKLTACIKKETRRMIRTIFKRPCDQGYCISVPAYGSIVQTCEVKEKKIIKQHTFCPNPSCGSVSLFSTDMIDRNGFSCTACNAEQRENFRRPSCLGCNIILSVQHGEEIRIDSIIAREPFQPTILPGEKNQSGYLFVAGDGKEKKGKAKKKQPVPKKRGAKAAGDGRGSKRNTNNIVKINKKRRLVANTADTAVTSLEVVVPHMATEARAPSLFSASDMQEDMPVNDEPTMSVADKTEDATSALFTRSRGAGKKRTRREDQAMKEITSEKIAPKEDLPWRFFSLVDTNEGCLAPVWLCPQCVPSWLDVYQHQITKQELQALFRLGSIRGNDVQNFLYNLEK